MATSPVRTGQSMVRFVKPVLSQTREEARHRVLNLYKKVQRDAPNMWWLYRMQDIPLPVFREVLKKQFSKNSQLSDLRVIDRKLEEGRQHMVSVKYFYYNEYHVRNMLFAENVEPKPKDFLSKFLLGKE